MNPAMHPVQPTPDARPDDALSPELLNLHYRELLWFVSAGISFLLLSFVLVWLDL